MEPVRFEVAYRFPEYRRFVFAHLATMKGITPGFFGNLLFSTVAAVGFWMKTRRVGRCVFTIDERGVHRQAEDGQMLVPWSKVTAIYRYGPGFLVEKGKGAMPIPYRCLEPGQRETLEALFAAHVPQS